MFSSRDAKRAARNKIPTSVFHEKPGVRCLSSDRLTIAPRQKAIQIAESVGEGRCPPRSFYGWAVVVAEKAEACGRQVVASPKLDNPYHADIVLPSEVPSEDEQEQHALALVRNARWCKKDQPAGSANAP